MSKIIRIPEIAKELGVSPKTVRAMLAQGIIPHLPRHSERAHYVVSRAAFERLIEQGGAQPAVVTQ